MDVKYWRGSIRSNDTKNYTWLKAWYAVAIEAEDKGCKLVVFEIPNNKSGFDAADTIKDIEKLLQERYKTRQ